LSFASWEAQGARDILERARERVRGLLAAEASPVLDAQQERDVEALVAEAESALSHTSIPA
jgi:trimethylamine:corrinoid methyltransferase-like protein